jgi:hypothetical protein
MITKENINSLVSKAKRSLAIKTVKYWTKVAFGNPCKKELEKLRLIKFYINILEAFEFIDSTQECDCCITSTFETELINGFPETKATFEFLKDNKGYFLYNEAAYTFTYEYVESQKLLTINFDFLENPLVFENIVFNENCNLTNNQDTLSFLQTAEVEVVNEPTPNPSLLSSLIIKDDNSNFIYQLTIPDNIKNSPEQIVELWNTTYSNTGFILNYLDGKYNMVAPLGNYINWEFIFNQFEGGVDPSCTFINPIPTPFVTQAVDSLATVIPNLSDFTGSGLITVETSTDGIIYGTSLNYTIDRFVENFNLFNTGGLTVEFKDGKLFFHSPTGSAAGYNGTDLIVTSYLTGLEIYTSTFSGGLDNTEMLLYWGVTIGTTTYIVHQDTTPVNYSSLQDIVDAFNNGNNQNLTAVLQGNNIKITTPLYTYNLLNGSLVELEYIYSSPEYTGNSITQTIAGGIQPSSVDYDDLFTNKQFISDFINIKECSPTTVQLTCLTNENIESIFNHLKMLI